RPGQPARRGPSARAARGERREARQGPRGRRDVQTELPRPPRLRGAQVRARAGQGARRRRLRPHRRRLRFPERPSAGARDSEWSTLRRSSDRPQAQRHGRAGAATAQPHPHRPGARRGRGHGIDLEPALVARGIRAMRIWIVNHYADPPDGLATRSFDIAKRLVEKGNPTTIFVSAFSHYHLRPLRKLGFRLWRKEDIEGVLFIWIAGNSYGGNDWRRVLNMLVFSGLAFLAGVLRREKPDVVIGVSVHPLAALVGYYLSRIKGARFLFEVTDLWPQTLIDFGRLSPDGRTARAMRRLERFLFRHAERIIMLWRHTDEYVASQGVSPSKIVWIPHGVELTRYEHLTPYLGAPARPFRVMFLGGFVASNSVDSILDAAEVLAGRG